MGSRVRINVGGEIFETSRTTLVEAAGRDSVLGALLDPSWAEASPFTASQQLPFFSPPHPRAFSSQQSLTVPPSSPYTPACFSPAHLPASVSETPAYVPGRSAAAAGSAAVTAGPDCARMSPYPATADSAAALACADGDASAAGAATAASAATAAPAAEAATAPAPAKAASAQNPATSPATTAAAPAEAAAGDTSAGQSCFLQLAEEDPAEQSATSAFPATSEQAADSLSTSAAPLIKPSHAGSNKTTPPRAQVTVSGSSSMPFSAAASLSTAVADTTVTSHMSQLSISQPISRSSPNLNPSLDSHPITYLNPGSNPSTNPSPLFNPGPDPHSKGFPSSPSPSELPHRSPSHLTPPYFTSPHMYSLPLSHALPSFTQAAPPPPPTPTQQPPEIFLDRDPRSFRALLNLLRTGHLDVPPGLSLDSVLCDADYLGLLDVAKGALAPPRLDANEMEKVCTLRPNVGPTEPCTALVGRDDGAVAAAHGSRITVYDWRLRRTHTIFSELHQVDTLCYLSDTRIVAGATKACDQLPIYDTSDNGFYGDHASKIGSIACTGASYPSFRAAATSDRWLFVSSLRKTLGAEWGVGKAVGVIDRETLQSVGPAGPAPVTTRRVGGPDRLQWLPSFGLLMVAKRYTPWVCGGSEGTSYLRLWDPRSNKLVWDWREFDDPQVSMVPADRWCALCDAAVCEDLSLLFKASPSCPDTASSRLSALDLRRLPPLPQAAPSSPAAAAAAAASAAAATTYVPSLGNDDWTVLHWQSPSEGLKVGGSPRSLKTDTNVLRLVAVPGSCQIICNRQPTLEVWTPVARTFADVAGQHGATSSATTKATAALQPGGMDGLAARGTTFAGGLSGALNGAAGMGGLNGGTTMGQNAGLTRSLTIIPPPRSSSASELAGLGGWGPGGSPGARAGRGRGDVDPYAFRRSYALSREEHARKRMSLGAPYNWVYDMSLGGNQRLFVVREDCRPGSLDMGAIEVWETRRGGGGRGGTSRQGE